jgi:hypothetical protein
MRSLSERRYTPDELALFAAYREYRARCRPAKCADHPEHCWVEHGPPAVGSGHPCRGCGAYPGIRANRPRRRHREPL